MPDRSWSAEAPSNIALIKYMGKTDARSNRPANASLSYTLGALRTRVEVARAAHDDGPDRWEPLRAQGWAEVSLSEKGAARYLEHFRRLKDVFGLPGSYVVRSANNFPSDCGLASSASSFAALTLAAHEIYRSEAGRELTRSELAEWSRHGSGSSCRSLFAPWSIWDEDGARALELPTGPLRHQVAIVDEGKKAVSSSEAHRRVVTSSLFEGRVARAETRLNELTAALRTGNWNEAFEITWSEFWDMHALFETSRPAFGYMTAGSLAVLAAVRSVWQERSDGPLVTMDAGANVHLLYRSDQEALYRDLARTLAKFARVFESPEGT